VLSLLFKCWSRNNCPENITILTIPFDIYKEPGVKMTAGILILQNENFSDRYNQLTLVDEIGDSALVYRCEDGRTIGWASAWRCGDESCGHAEDADTTAAMRGILLDGEHGEVVCVHGGNFANEKARFDRVS
jgi:hypothetical protein